MSTTSESLFPNCAFLIGGDFNNLPISTLMRQFRLKQLVKFPTRCSNTLDLILTKFPQYYGIPTKLPPFGLSDHFTVVVEPKFRQEKSKSTSHIMVRRKNSSSIRNLGIVLSSINWDIVFQDHSSSNQMSESFNDVVNLGLHTFMPLKSVLICHQDTPWMTISFKTLIKKRQKALAEGKENLFKIYRNKVNKEHKLIRRSFYREKVQSTESRDPI